jgi:hypothetical protein
MNWGRTQGNWKQVTGRGKLTEWESRASDARFIK